MCLCCWRGSQRKRKKRKDKKKERQNRYQELGHLSQIYSGSKWISTTKVKSRGLTALSEFAAGGPSRKQKSTVLREWGPEAWIPRQTDLICGTLDRLTSRLFSLLQSMHDNGVNIADTLTVKPGPRRSKRMSVLLDVVSSQCLDHVWSIIDD